MGSGSSGPSNAQVRSSRDQAIARINAASSDARDRRAKEDAKHRREHEQKMLQMRAEQEKQKKAAELKMQQDKQAHEQRLKKMKIDAEKQDKAQKLKQKNAAINQITIEINKLDNKITQDATSLVNSKEDLEKTSKELEYENDWIDKFENYRATELSKKSDEIDLKDAKQKFEHDDKQIKEAIDKTGQHDADVGKFLKLTHGLMGATMATTAHSNKLSIEISTFGELISRECQDKLTIEHYFNENHLEKFVPILANENFVDLDDLVCDDDDEFKDEILTVLEEGIKKQKQIELKKKKKDKKNDDNKDNDDDNTDTDDEKDPAELAKELLTQWGLDQFYDTMIDEGWDDSNDWGNLEDDDLKDMGFKKGNISKFRKKLSAQALIKKREKRILKKICLKPKSWEKYQLEKVKATKEGLLVISPLLGEFFTKIHIGIKQSQQMLSYDTSLNDQQQKAIQNVRNLAPIEYIKSNNNDDDKDKDNDNDDGDNKNDDDYNDKPLTDADDEKNDIELSTPGFNDPIIDPQNDIRKEWKIDSLVEIYSDSLKKWFKGTIINITNDNQGEWLHIKYTTPQQDKTKQIQRGSSSVRPIVVTTDVAVQCRALTVASIISIDVTDTMMNKFNQSPLTMRALTVARGVEDCCMQIVRSQGTIRQSVLLAQEILKLKPAYLSDKAQVLWKAVDDGIINIFECALKMVKVSATYFSYFLKFKQSFGYYISTTQNDPNVSLLVSLQHVKKDVRDFTVFQKDFNQTVDRLNKEAMNCIRNCVENQIGAANFEKFQNSREKTLKTWLDKKKIYDERALELDGELDKHQQKRIILSSEEARLKYQVDMLTQSIQRNTNIKSNYISTKTYFEKMVI